MIPGWNYRKLSRMRITLFIWDADIVILLPWKGALKLKEISYIHAEGYPAAEMKHGPIALIDAEMPVVVIATQNGMYEKVLSNIQEIQGEEGKSDCVRYERRHGYQQSC